MKKTLPTIATTTIVAFAGTLFLWGNEDRVTNLPIPTVIPKTAQIAPLPDDKEIERVKAIASKITQNDLGYWEAVFEDGPTLIFIPSNTFTIGNPKLSDATPAHQVTLSSYWISKYPVTIGNFRRFVKATGYITNVELSGHPGSWVYNFDSKGFEETTGHRWDNGFHQVTAKFPELTINDQHPVANVSWYDCIAYTNWLTQETGLPFTLPTEAEWEYAARGTDGRVYPWGNQPPDGTRANYADDRFNRYFPDTEQSLVHHGVDDGFAMTSPVGSFPAGRSPFGGLDMAGNVTEWVFDSYYDYTAEPKTNPVYGHNDGTRMQKAGFWAGSAGRFNVQPDEIKDGHNIRADARQGDDAASADDHLGCRVAISYVARPYATQ